MSRALRRVMLAAALLLLPQAARAQAVSNDDAVAIVKRAARIYSNLSGLQADFRQRLIDSAPGMGTRDTKGSIYQSGNNKFAMRWSDPAGDLVVIDGTSMIVYTPSDYPKVARQSARPTGQTYGASANLLGYFLDNATERYRISYVKSESVDGVLCDAVKLDPIAKDMSFRSATIWFARSDNLPHKLRIIEALQIRELTLSHVQPNVSIAAEKFKFVAPPGVRTVSQ